MGDANHIDHCLSNLSLTLYVPVEDIITMNPVEYSHTAETVNRYSMSDVMLVDEKFIIFIIWA